MTVQLSVCYETITEESATHGDADDRGFVRERELVDVREAITELSRCSELSSGSVRGPQHLSGHEWASTEPDQDYQTGEYYSESVHIARADGSDLAPRALFRLFRAAGLVMGKL